MEKTEFEVSVVGNDARGFVTPFIWDVKPAISTFHTFPADVKGTISNVKDTKNKHCSFPCDQW